MLAILDKYHGNAWSFNLDECLALLDKLWF